MENNFIIGSVESQIGKVPQVSTHLNRKDYLGTIKVRSGINRESYKVDPGIYAAGIPDENSDVIVTANYKLSFDEVRKNLDGLNAWILVLDTKGINVWCAAGKGTFGTKEIVNRIKITSVEKIVKHKRLILPQLGAVGVSAHQVKSLSGFSVIYGPVRAADIKQFIKERYKASKEMRRVSFNFYDRIKLIPVDFVYGINYLLALLLLIFLLSGINGTGISFQQASLIGLPIMRNVFIGYLGGIVITPMLLPYIPVRSFALKGFIVGILLSLVLFFNHALGSSTTEIISYFIFISSISSFLAMNFTGASTFTSLSGVKKEMKIAVPFQVAFTVIALVLVIAGIII